MGQACVLCGSNKNRQGSMNCQSSVLDHRRNSDECKKAERKGLKDSFDSTKIAQPTSPLSQISASIKSLGKPKHSRISTLSEIDDFALMEDIRDTNDDLTDEGTGADRMDSTHIKRQLLGDEKDEILEKRISTLILDIQKQDV